MYGRTLTLQSRSKQIQGIDGTSTKSPTESANAGCGEVSECHIVIIALIAARFPPEDDPLQVLKGSEVDGTVREHANETHGKTAVEGTNATRSPHLASSG